jgi:DNA-binding NarL/FixJ family response regulator
MMNAENSGVALRILTVDDHPLFREGVRALILGQPDLEIVGEASGGREAMEQYRSKKPDITLMDLQMPGISGIDTIIAIRNEHPDARIIVLTTHVGDAYVRRALDAGARAYVLKSTARKDLLNTIRDVYRGLRHVEPNLATELAFQQHNSDLTDREIAVLSLIADGNSNRDVGAALGIQEETVKSHVKVILGKLNARDRTHAVTTAMRRGIIPLMQDSTKRKV